MQRLEVNGAVRPLYVSLGFKGLSYFVNSEIYVLVICIFVYYGPDLYTEDNKSMKTNLES
jgi:hypothetical protein